jgi:hypothetical protein
MTGMVSTLASWLIFTFLYIPWVSQHHLLIDAKTIDAKTIDAKTIDAKTIDARTHVFTLSPVDKILTISPGASKRLHDSFAKTL